jgi:iron complex outermembrane receptor protein
MGIKAQSVLEDSTIELNEFLIKADRLNEFSYGSKVQNTESSLVKQYKTQNLSELIRSESSVFIKSYGPGNLTTSSIRGASANQTAIIFNGFNINSPMNGISDLSLVPVYFFDDMQIQYGGSGTLWGSGSIGGSIHLNNHPFFNKGVNISAGSSVGSFNSLRHNIDILLSGQKWTSIIKVFRLTAENNFPFYNTALSDTPLQDQTNSEIDQSGLFFENYFKLNKGQTLEVALWYQKNKRNIPTSMLGLEENSHQNDDNLRLTTEWKRSVKKVDIFIRSAFFNEQIVYEDKTINLLSLSASSTLIYEAETKIRTGKGQLLNLGLNNTNISAKADAYNGIPKQSRLSLFSLYRISLFDKKLESVIGARQEIIIGSTPIPLTWSAGLTYIPFKCLSFHLNAGKVYRLPTFNDLYWIPGNNPDLSPESGYISDLGIKLKLSGKHLKFNFDPNIFNRNINNWIIWLPGLTFWTPQNLMKVWSRGIETKSGLNYSVKNISIKLNVLTSYVLSTNEKKKSENDLSVGKQLIYVPIYNGHSNLIISYKKFKFSYSHSYTGYRYTSTDNSQYIPPYSLADIYVAYKLKLKQYSADISFKLNNIFNEKYQVVMNRPMPMMNYQLGLNINFKNSKK